jgi:AcrR family transcriptional regulator
LKKANPWRAGVTAERLTLAAADLADEVGLDNVTVSALARNFGVKDASLHSHIKNAQDCATSREFGGSSLGT